MLDQIRVFKLVDKVDVKLSEAAGKLTRIMLLAELLAMKYGDSAKDCTDEQLRAMAGLRGSRKQRSKPARISESGQLSVRLDGERQPLLLERSQALFKAPEPTALKKGDVIRIAFDDNALEGTMRWEYGKVVKVHAGKELLDIDLDNGQQLRAAPLYDVCAVR